MTAPSNFIIRSNISIIKRVITPVQVNVNIPLLAKSKMARTTRIMEPLIAYLDKLFNSLFFAALYNAATAIPIHIEKE
ncbi:hypothetical protein ES708_27493 [subsurface metagenome]